ncbi:MAG: DUF4143 domain-containing protein [Candidatus Methanoplasma sp.]|jgi:predicted AAA+ superfamily ATPase|nr:DUF4143 domain-containing protein [Candidatus Methanoplasma sp.]
MDGIPEKEMRARYRPRVIDSRISHLLRVFGGVQITGCKWCGKSWTGLYHSKSSVFIGTDTGRKVAEMDPQLVLGGEEPRLIDEWQDAPNLWDVARMNIDFSARKGMYIFTGSSTPPAESVSHTGVGRFATVEMRPMSLFESGDSRGSVSLSAMFDGAAEVSSWSDMDYMGAIRLICRGGWPGGLGASMEDALLIPRVYSETLARMDLSRVDGVKRDPGVMRALLKSLARNNATAAKAPALAADMAGGGDPVSEQTVRSYMGALKSVFAIGEQPAWVPSLRSRKRLRTSPKRHFADPSLAAALMEAGPEEIARDPNAAGFLFESMCYRDLSAYSSAFGGRVGHYLDDSGLEVDSIVERGDGRWGAVEVKMGHRDADKAAASLLRLKEKLAGEAAEPSFLMVLCATGGAAYMRGDGVAVVPLDCLGP